MVFGLPVDRCVVQISRWPRKITTFRPSMWTSPSPTRFRERKSKRCERTAQSSGSRCIRSGTSSRALCTSLVLRWGLTQPGMTIVCGDSHTSTHGAFGALAFGIGTSEVEHVLATQTLPLKPFKTMAINVEGDLPEGVSRKGHHLGCDRQDRDRRRAGLRSGVPRFGDSRLVHGRTHDGLQYVDRGRCAGRHDRPGSHNIRLRPRP